MADNQTVTSFRVPPTHVATTKDGKRVLKTEAKYVEAFCSESACTFEAHVDDASSKQSSDIYTKATAHVLGTRHSVVVKYHNDMRLEVES